MAQKQLDKGKLEIFSKKISTIAKNRICKLQKWETSLSGQVMLIKHNSCRAFVQISDQFYDKERERKELFDNLQPGNFSPLFTGAQKK